MPAARPNIFQFLDYREYLHAFYAFEKARNPKFSQRFIQQKVGASSSGWFSDLIGGRIQLTGTLLLRLSRLLDLTPHEEDYFEALVRFNQAGSFDEKGKLYERLLSFKELKVDLVDRDRFEYFSHWHHAAIRELLFVTEFTGDFASLAKKLTPAIRTEDARKSVHLLEKLQFIERDPAGRYVPTNAILKKDSAFKSIHLGSFLKSTMALAIDSLERFPKEARDISALTLALSKEDMEIAKSEIKSLRKRLLQLSESGKRRDKVYQCNIQLFPVTA